MDCARGPRSASHQETTGLTRSQRRQRSFLAGALDELLRRIGGGEIEPSFIITHTVPIDRGPEMYRKFRDREDGCIKVVLKPWD